MQGLKINHVSKRGPSGHLIDTYSIHILFFSEFIASNYHHVYLMEVMIHGCRDHKGPITHVKFNDTKPFEQYA